MPHKELPMANNQDKERTEEENTRTVGAAAGGAILGG
jgi:hypothetical protein